MNKSFSQSFKEVALSSVLAALIIFASEALLADSYAEIHFRTFVFFLVLYVALALGVSVGTAALLKILGNILQRPFWRADSPAFGPAITAFFYFFVYGFYYLNEKLTPGVGMFAPLSLFADILFLGLGFVLFRIILLNQAREGSRFVSSLNALFLPLSLLVAVNLRYFAWQPPVMRTGELFLGLSALGGVAIAGALLARIISSKFASHRSAVVAVANLSVGGLILFWFMQAAAPSTESFDGNSELSLSSSRVPKPRNIIWIVTDTARRDHISVYGSEINSTPNLEKFAEEALVFDRAIATAPWTLPSHASMFTGMFASKHGAHYVGDAIFSTPLLPDNLTLAEVLSSQGYQTAGIAANNAGLSRQLGCHQGFQYYFDAPPFVFSLFWGKVLQKFSEDFRVDHLWINEVCLSSEINPIVFDWLNGRDTTRPFFLFINYMEPHGGIAFVPEPYDSMYGFDRDKQPDVFDGFDADEVIHFKAEVTDKQRAFWTSYVQRKNSFMDFHLGRLFDRLKAMGLFNDSIIIVNSDHGELFGEHNSFGHNTDLYNELIQIPMMVRYPAAGKKGRTQKLVQTIDVMPEIMSQLGLEIPENIQGQPFDAVDHAIVAELFQQQHNAHAKRFPERYYRDLKAMYATENGDSLKYIWASDEKSELFDLAADPKELENIILQCPAQSDLMDERLQRWQQSFVPLQLTDKTSEKDREELEKRLRSLGYIK